MRGMDGRELADRVVALRPRTQVIYMSGYTDDVETKHGLEESRETGYLAKPFTPSVLATRVREMLDRNRDRPR
jgi:DNA-binding response OmpR family regulator